MKKEVALVAQLCFPARFFDLFRFDGGLGMSRGGGSDKVGG
jgi:hypothetical protein